MLQKQNAKLSDTSVPTRSRYCATRPGRCACGWVGRILYVCMYVHTMYILIPLHYHLISHPLAQAEASRLLTTTTTAIDKSNANNDNPANTEDGTYKAAQGPTATMTAYVMWLCLLQHCQLIPIIIMYTPPSSSVHTPIIIMYTPPSSSSCTNPPPSS